MKKVLNFAVFACAFSLLSAFGGPAYLWYEVSAFDPEGWNYFDVARIGVADANGALGVYLANVVDANTTVPFVESDAMKSTAYGWADISAYASENYFFFAEAYKDGSLVLAYDSETAVNYATIFAGNHISQDLVNSQTASITPWVIPEPTCGVLLLLGLAFLVLRRRRVHGLVCSLVLLASSAAFAAADDTLVSFSTKGPDKYLDGTIVKDGECYALVWTKTGATFAGIAADGKAVGSDSEVLVFAPIAKDGHCPSALFEIDATLAKGYANGSFSVYLLDTRLASGAVGGVNVAGVPVAVNGWGEVKVKGEDEGEQRSGSDSSACVTMKSAVPVDAPKPQITAIKLVGDKVFLTVKNTLPCLQYAAKEVSVDRASAVQTQQDAASTQGAVTADAEITVIAPQKGKSGFFTVGRR